MRRHGSHDLLPLDIDPALAGGRFEQVYRGTDGSDDFTGAEGADKWIAGNGNYDSFDGRGGVDRAVIDYSANENAEYYLALGSDAHSYSGSGSDEFGDGANAFFFDNVEQVFLTGSPTSESYLLYDLPATSPDQRLRIDGGGGGDYLYIQMDAEQSADMTFVVEADGHAHGTLGDFYKFDSYVVYLGKGNDRLVGGAGDDTLDGARGDDIIKGGAGDDILYGRKGSDVLTGGKGEDVFAFLGLADFATGRAPDTITDFSGAGGEHDRIGFEHFARFTFIGADSFDGDGTAELRATPVTGGYLVRGDLDGDGHGDFRLLVLTDAPLTAEDFGARSSRTALHAEWVGFESGYLPLA